MGSDDYYYLTGLIRLLEDRVLNLEATVRYLTKLNKEEDDVL